MKKQLLFLSEMEEETKPQLLNLNNIPVELLQAILLDVAQHDLPSLFVCPLVCHKWNNILKVLPQPKKLKADKDLDKGPQRPSGCKAMAIAARNGHHSLLKWFRKQGCPWDQGCCAAAKGGHLEVLMWLKDQGCPFKATPTFDALMRMVKWREDFLLNNPSPDTDLYALEGIPTKERILDYWERNPRSYMGRTAVKAAKGGHSELLQWAVANDFPVGKTTIAAAARVGNLEIVKWLVVEQNCERNNGRSRRQHSEDIWMLLNGSLRCTPTQGIFFRIVIGLTQP